MGKEFKRLKRYNATWTMLRTLALGLSMTMLLLGAVLALHKMHVIQAEAWHYVVSIAVSLAAMAGYGILQHKSDLRLAEKIDAEHQLKERVQTMVEYQHGDTAMLQVQREDTERRLKEVRRFGQKKLVLAGHFLLIVVAVAVFAVGVIMPVQAIPVEPTPTEPPYEVTEWQKSALANLIDHVIASNMADAAKEPSVEQLRKLQADLETEMTAGVLKNKVIEVIKFVYQVTDEVNSNDDIYDVVLNNVGHAQAENLAYALGALQNKERANQIAQLETVLVTRELRETWGQLADDLDVALSKSAFDEKDDLYNALKSFTERLHKAADATNEETALSTLGMAVNALKNNANAALTQQEATKEECVYVVDKLCSIFAISGQERPGDPDPEIARQDSDKQDAPSTPGGAPGDPNMQFAGKDRVYDYRIHDYVEYGKLITEYYNEVLQDLNRENIPEEVRALIEKYFQELMAGNSQG